MSKKFNLKKRTSQAPLTPRRETEAFRPRMRDRLLRSLRREVFQRLAPGVPGLNHNFNPHRFDLREVEDLRHAQKGDFHKGRYLRLNGTTSGYGYQPIPVYSRLRRMREVLQLRFFEPRQTVVCRRRQARRRVLFALQKTGRRGVGNRIANWSAASYIRCK